MSSLSSNIYSLTRIKPYRYTLFLLVCMVIIHLVQIIQFLPVSIGVNPFWICAQGSLFCLMLFQLKFWWLGGISWFILYQGLKVINDVKWNFTKFYLTELDFTAALNDLNGLLNVAGIEQKYHMFAFVLLTLAFVTSASIISFLYHKSKLYRLIHLLCCLISLPILYNSYDQYGSYLYSNRHFFINSKGVEYELYGRNIEKRTGPLGFIALTRFGIKYDHQTILHKHEPSSKNKSKIISSKVTLPNIMFILAESTFKIHNEFDIKPEIAADIFLNSNTQESGELIVPTVGGGTWKSEFETITGMKTKLFGLRGEYPHQLLSSHVVYSFPYYLQQLNYDSSAYYPVNGLFYNARKAYNSYGFKRFFDANDLNINVAWKVFSDEIMMDKVLNQLELKDVPQFHYVVLLQNHGPHECENFKSQGDLKFNLVKTATFNQNCEVNEYLLRLQSTEKGFLNAVKKFKSIEKKTGRPYVVVIFGDHQPFTFTSNTYDLLRSKLELRRTFFTINYSSQLAPLKINLPISASSLPSYISLLLIKDQVNAFLPENFKFEAKQDAALVELFTKRYSEMVVINQ